MNPSKSVTLSREKYEQLLHHPVANSDNPTTSSSSGAFVASHGESWMLDPGATTHLIGNRSNFSNLSTSQKLPNPPSVPLADGSYSPDLALDLQTRRIIGGGHERGGLYFLNTAPPNDKVLPIKSPHLECESCELGKHHRASFPSRVDNRSSSPFTLVHSDIWGPCYFESISGFHYFITFVDDYSKMTYVYLLKDRFQVPTIITSFYNEINTQFFANIRILRTDSALEFVQKTVSDFCESKGVLHQTSYPYTSQQNNVAERKHRHLLDVAQIIMTSMNVPKSYWGDAILTACYLINRMPSSILNGDTPYSCIFPDTPLFGVYSCRNRSTNTTLTAPPGLPLTAAPGNPSATPANDLPLLFRKVKDRTLERYKARLVAKGSLPSNTVQMGPLNGERQHMVCKLRKLYMVLNKVLEHVYVDDILITGSDIVGIEEAKTYLQKHFVTKDLGIPRYFLRIEIAHSKHGVSLSQRKYACDLFQEAGLLGTKSVGTPMNSNPDFWNDDVSLWISHDQFIGKLL
ncbi:Retrovirus-related Pol polyprotein from transposon TNT 1-94 [Sesamum angolense]|uniref:Retrovirus-related Pol polyprotein from transposon TNT 1-94 n=1 Tax=Sesamum angolense TaxID=2727404 RepID=A0AAE1W3L0_9LAMI|nr:Retrovirus-related Pol polyprotein from transposon TNT 1-94 [Sesamum angolense]